MDIRLLGSLEVVDHDRLVALPQGRARSLLALLALHPGVVMPTDRLVDELWGGAPPRTAVTALQGLVSTLRKRLEPSRPSDHPPTVLVTHAPGYVLAVDREQVDTHRFRRLVDDALDAPAPERARRLRTALALWRGAALADFTYEPFAQAPISALEELRVTALEARIGADLALGRHAEVVAELDELVAAHPLREGLRAHLMVALYRCGRQAEALDVYRVARRELVEEIGMEPGPRLRALEQAVLAHDPGLLNVPDPVGVVSRGDHERPGTGGAWLVAGRRTVTAVFVDLALTRPPTAAGVDPEATRPVLSRGHATARQVLEGHGGTIEGSVGDVVVAVFGLPVAHEDDAVRAVRAASVLGRDLLDVNADAERHHGVRLAARVGIDTGEVVVGDPAGAATSGPPITQAARLQQVATHGEVLLSETTRRLVQEAAVVEPVGVPAEAVADGPVWRLVEVVASPLEVVPGDTSHVGRTDELDELHAAFDRSVHEQRAVLVTVMGEAGVGKSRLARAFAAAVAGEARVVTGHCRAYGEGITFWPLREIVQDLVGEAGPEGLAHLMGREPDGASHAEQIAAATGLSAEPMRRPGDLFVAVRRLFEQAARDGPLVVVVEDVHWAQPTLLDLVEYLAETVRAPVVLLSLARPELAETRPGWGAEVGPVLQGRDARTSVELRPLGMAEARQLVIDRLEGRLLPPESVGRILAMGQGNPLFLEQLLAALREDHEVVIPATVQALLMARLDRLGPAERDLVRCASAIGVDVPLDALRALLPDEARPHLDRHVRTLAAKQLIRRRVSSVSGGPGFEFWHVLIQQAAYRSLTHASRADLHESVATWLNTEADIPVVEVEELVGFHLEQAVQHRRDLGRTDATTDELAVQAGERLASAGLRAYGRFDVPAAENLLSRARGLLPPDHPHRPRVLRRLTEAYPVMGRPDEATDCFEELLALVGEDGEGIDAHGVRLEHLRFRLITGPDPIPMATIQQEAEDALEAFRRAGDEVLASQAHYVLASVHLRAGRMQELAEIAWRGIERARQAGELRERLGAPWWVVFHLLAGPTPVPDCIRACEEVMDVGGVNHLGVVAALGHFRAMLGDIDEGRRLVVRARDLLRERIRLPRPLSFIGQQRAEVELLAGDLDTAAGALRQALDVALQVTERDQAAQIAARLSFVRSRQGDTDEAAALATLASEQAPAEGITAQAMARAAAAYVLVDRGDLRKAEGLIRGAIAALPDDMLLLRAFLHETGAEVARADGREQDARMLRDLAVDLHRRKGNLVGARLATGGRQSLAPPG